MENGIHVYEIREKYNEPVVVTVTSRLSLLIYLSLTHLLSPSIFLKEMTETMSVFDDFFIIYLKSLLKNKCHNGIISWKSSCSLVSSGTQVIVYWFDLVCVDLD